jgi:DNA-binding helix-hairpin-helix protein with protein kinase domain
MENDWTREIERLTDLLKKSEEEMLFWRRAHRDAEKENAALKAERDGYRNGQQQMQDINAKLIDANNALHAEIEKLRIKEAMEASHE